MTASFTLTLADDGTLTLPESLQEKYDLEPGRRITLLDLDGIFVVIPTESKIDALADNVRAVLEAQGESLESMLVALRETREQL